MCGIAGLIFFERSADHQTIRKMADCMAHRGPDSDGYFVSENVALGFRRLSIIDLSSAANQPLASNDGRFHIIFNGELYNFRDVRRKMNGTGFTSNGDTEVLVEAYAKWGISCLEYFRGMFAFAIWDDQEKELCIVRDRMGVKPLYYYADDKQVIFASEIKAIIKSGLVKTGLNEEALVDYLSFQSISSPQTLVDGIKQLEAGHYIKVKGNKVEIKQYWDLTAQTGDYDYSEPTAVKKKIRELLTDSVNIRLVSDVPLGAFLSGGIDSSAVVGLMAEVSNARPNTFSIAFGEKDFDESEYAEMVAKRFNTIHQRILMKPSSMLDELENALNAMDTPSGDGINTYIVSKAVKSAGLTVALSGIGGDELFAGYPFFKTYYRLNRNKIVWNNSAVFRKIAAPVVSFQGSARNVKIAELLNSSSTGIRDLYPIFRKVIPQKDIRKMLRDAGLQHPPLQKKLLTLSKAIQRFPLLSQVSIAEYLGYTQQTLLKDTDQMSMAVSLEVREPFFDHKLIEYVLGVPDNLKYPAYPKSLLVESLDGLLPGEIVHRKKQGFTFPWHYWLKNELKSFCEGHLTRLSQRRFINAEVLMQTWKEFLTGSEKVRWMDIWLFVVLSYWLEKNEVD